MHSIQGEAALMQNIVQESPVLIGWVCCASQNLICPERCCEGQYQKPYYVLERLHAVPFLSSTKQVTLS